MVSPMSDCIKTRLNCLTVNSNHERLHQDNAMEFRAIERVTGVHHTTIIGWVKKIVHA
ncbi:MAG: hypothetical protein F6K55_47285 [Moorea sp. SIO4A3]|nr:hypothetical protein [Moorena sp. SIO4A3]